MYENFNEPLAHKEVFHRRVLKSGMIALSIFITAISTGILGYHFIAGFSWIDAFLNASMILSGMGLVEVLTNDCAKIFSGFYALFSGITFLSTMAIFLAPVVHRIIHKYHIQMKK